MRSALGLRRIRDIEVSQVLEASTADIYNLKGCLSSWGVPTFSNYPLLLRALTHPSISNWAERILAIRKRSLGPNALELLGDRVVGLCVASRVHDWRSSGGADISPKLQQWSLVHGNSSIITSLVGNRGMALAAQRAGIADLMRWEKPSPPAAHRHRLDANGIDIATGLGVNREINALAAAYEAVAAAIYLDQGLEAASSFVSHTLLPHVPAVQRANTGAREYAEALLDEVAQWVGVPVREFSPVGVGTGGLWPRGPMGSRAQFGVVDLEQRLEEGAVADASPTFYAAVVLRPMGEGKKAFDERDLLSVASHFSVETARIAAVTQAIESVRGRRTEIAVRKGRAGGTTALRFIPQDAELSQHGPVELRFENQGARWERDGDYAHVAQVLQRFYGPDVDIFGGNGNTNEPTALQERIQQISKQTRRHVEQATTDKAKRTQRRPHHFPGQWQPPSRRPHPAESPLPNMILPPHLLARYLRTGSDIHSTQSLHLKHPAINGELAPAAAVSASLQDAMRRLLALPPDEQMAHARGLHVVGQHAARLWSVQRSMDSAAQDRAEIVPMAERRAAWAAPATWPGGMAGIGACVRAHGGAGLAWLTGVEALADEAHEGTGGAEVEASGMVTRM